MIKMFRFYFFVVLILLVGLACNFSSDPVENLNTSPPSNENSGPLSTEGAPAISFTVTNGSSRTVCALFVTLQESTEWGDERLGTEVLGTGASFGLDVPDGNYRLRANDCDNQLIAEYNDFEINGTASLRLEDRTVNNSILAAGEPGTLTVINHSGGDVCYIYISSAESSSWGNDWLGEDTILDDGDSQTISVGAGLYDIKASDCDGQALAEQYDIDLATGQTWTLEN